MPYNQKSTLISVLVKSTFFRQMLLPYMVSLLQNGQYLRIHRLAAAPWWQKSAQKSKFFTSYGVYTRMVPSARYIKGLKSIRSFFASSFHPSFLSSFLPFFLQFSLPSFLSSFLSSLSCGNAANLEDKTKEMFASVKKI